MLKHPESTPTSTPVPLLPVLCIQTQEGLTEPLRTPKQQGREAGQTEATQMLAQAEQAKGAALTQGEIRDALHPLLMARLEDVKTKEKPQEWWNGWYSGAIETCFEAERQAAPEPSEEVADFQVEVVLVPGSLPFRKAVIETESLHDLKMGIECGQEYAVELRDEPAPLSSHDLACLFAETINSEEVAEAYSVGFLLGVVDGLLRARKTYPRGGAQ